MLLLVLVIGSGLGWALHKVRAQAVAVAALEKTGFLISYDRGDDPLTLDERLRHWFGETNYRNVLYLAAEGPQITDDVLGQLESLPHLRDLYLHRTQVTDAGLVHLEPLAELERLSISNARVTDDGLAHIRRLTQLNYLSLACTQVTGAGLLQLRSLTRLRSLGLRGTTVTDVEADPIRKALPKCIVYPRSTDGSPPGPADCQ